MAELIQKFHVMKNGVTEELSIYTTLDEVQNKGFNIRVGELSAYLAYDVPGNPNESMLSFKKQNNSTVYRILKSVKKAVQEVTLRCFDAVTGNQLSSSKFPVTIGNEFYLNNTNAPVVSGYDFVKMDGISHIIQTGTEVFDLRYVNNTIPNRTKKDWSYYYNNGADRLNTYSMNRCDAMFYGASSLSMPFNTSNLQTFSDMFYNCSFPTLDIELDTTRAVNLCRWINQNQALQSIPWPIDMRSCITCDGMFIDTPQLKGVHFKNVPRSLDLSRVGINSYTVDNYIN